MADGVRWLDYEQAAEPGAGDASGDGTKRPDRFDGPHRREGDRFDGPHRSEGDRFDGLHRSEGNRFDGPHRSEGNRLDGPHRPEGNRLDGPHRPERDRLDGSYRPEGDWFDGPQRPPRLADSRPYGVPGGLAQPDPQVERDLAEALRPGARFPDPRGTWVRLINGGGPADDPFRASNAADCALAVLSTWHGEPATAAPRQPEYDRIGRPLLTGEQGSVARIERWAGQRLQYAGQGRHAYPMIARRLLDAGHGAGAVIVVRWPGGGSHAWNAVNFDGEVLWVDAQRGHMSVEPPYRTVTGVFCVILDRRGRPR
ncbi:toxin glutamine deamidase domain-containing protein [Nonomuraea sp. NPDC050404]|uniref:toxin glutamine deamidase domain-containing protein n=1 Tax=Nonomuraea sp. NPDC050404 TaxID=3155783 RepID=UPI003404CF1B